MEHRYVPVVAVPELQLQLMPAGVAAVEQWHLA